MAHLTLSNDLAPTTQNVTGEKSNLASKLAKSLATGNNELSSAVDQFIGLSLKDLENIFNGFKGGLPYTMGIIDTASNTLDNMADTLGSMIDTISSSSKVSPEKLVVLNNNLSILKNQVEGMVKRAKFDNKSVLSGGAAQIQVKIGLGVSDTITVSIQDLTSLWRNGASNSINDFFSADYKRISSTFKDQNSLNTASVKGDNLTQIATVTSAELSRAIVATRDDNNSFTRLAERSAEHLPKLQALITTIGQREINEARLAEIMPTLSSVVTDGNTDAIVTASNGAIVEGNTLTVNTQAVLTAAALASVPGAENAANANAANAASANIIGTQAAATFLGFQTGASGNTGADFITAVGNLLEAGTAVMTDANTAAIGPAVAAAVAAGIAAGDDKATILAAAGVASDAAAAVATAPATKAEVEAIVGSLIDAHKQGVDAARTQPTLLTISEDGLAQALGDADAKAEFLRNLVDLETFDISTDTGRDEATDVVEATSNKVRTNQAELKNQRENLEQAEKELFSQVVLLSKSAGSFLDTDYTKASIAYSKALREISAAISALQAMNKVPEAAQRLVDAIAR